MGNPVLGECSFWGCEAAMNREVMVRGTASETSENPQDLNKKRFKDGSLDHTQFEFH